MNSGIIIKVEKKKESSTLALMARVGRSAEPSLPPPPPAPPVLTEAMRAEATYPAAPVTSPPQGPTILFPFVKCLIKPTALRFNFMLIFKLLCEFVIYAPSKLVKK